MRTAAEPQLESFLPQQLESYLPRLGLQTFRPGQRAVIESVLAGHDSLCLMPTGGGKSLCYQLPAVAREGVVLVISPLIALMKDQVDALLARDIRATFINSTLTPDEQYARLDGMAEGAYDLVYVVPERFRSGRFLKAAERTQLQLLAVDEAHCVSEWGHDFRPDYARLGQFREALGNPPTIALTATATRIVQEDIVKLLALREPQCFVHGFARPNLRYEVEANLAQRDKDDHLVEFLRDTPGSGIVYTSTRKRCEEVVETLRTRTRRSAHAYHAGLAPEDRKAAQEAFMSDEAEVIVATNAFGMGIDKSDVRFVVHYNMPGTVEAYYQEAGRAGRDGEPSRCLMLHSGGDRYVQEFFIESASPSREVIGDVYEFLRACNDDPIELTQDQIKQALQLDASSEAVRQCEVLLEKSGALRRLDARENQAVICLNSDLPTLVDLLPPQARVQRKVLRALERLVGRRRHEPVYFNRQELARREEIDAATLTRTLANLRELEAIDYIPPFRGRAIQLLAPDVAFELLEIDFDTLERRRAYSYEKLQAMLRLVEGRGCRQQQILHYFGEQPAEPCGNCDICLSGGPGAHLHAVGGDGDEVLGEVVRKALAGVARSRGRFGRVLVAQMLCGSKAENVTRFGLHKLSTYGLLGQLKQNEVVSLLDALLAAGCLRQTGRETGRPLVQITELGEEVMREQAELEAGLALAPALAARLCGRRAARERPTGVETECAPPDAELLTSLRAWRTGQATAEGVPAYRVLTNATLQEIAVSRPATPTALQRVKGIGPARLESYGPALLDLVRSAAEGSDTNGAPTTSDGAATSEEGAAPEMEYGRGVGRERGGAVGEPEAEAGGWQQAAEPAAEGAEGGAVIRDEGSASVEESSAVEESASAGASAGDRGAAVSRWRVDRVAGGDDMPERDSIPESDGDPAARPAHYWTWRLLADGFTPREVTAIRGLSQDDVIDHALRAVDEGRPVTAAWLLAPDELAALEEALSTVGSDDLTAGDLGDRSRVVAALAAATPHGIGRARVQLFLKCRGDSAAEGG